MPKTKPENDAELKDLQQVNASLDKELKKLDKASEALEKEWKARRKTEPGSKKREAADRKFYDAQTVFFAQKEAIAQKYKATLKSQSPSFYGGPKSASEEDVHEWATGNYITLRLLSSQSFLSLGHKDQGGGSETSVDRENRERASAANKMPALTELGVRYLWNHKPAGMYLSGKAPTLPAGQTYEQAMARTRALAQEQYRGLFGDDEFSFKSDSLKKTREIYQAGELKKEEERKAAEQRSAALLDELDKEIEEEKQNRRPQNNEEDLDRQIEDLEKELLDDEGEIDDPETEQILKESKEQLDQAQKETAELKSKLGAADQKFNEMTGANRGENIPDEELYAELGEKAPEKDGAGQVPKAKRAADPSEYVRIEPFEDEDEKEDREDGEEELKKEEIAKEVPLPENDIPLVDVDAREKEAHKQKEKEEEEKQEQKETFSEPKKKIEEPVISDSEKAARALAEEEAEQRRKTAQKDAQEKEEKKKQEQAFMALFDDPEPKEDKKEKKNEDPEPEAESKKEGRAPRKEPQAQKKGPEEAPKEDQKEDIAPEDAPKEDQKEDKAPEEAPKEDLKEDQKEDNAPEEAPKEAPKEDQKEEKEPEEAPKEDQKEEKEPEEAPKEDQKEEKEPEEAPKEDQKEDIAPEEAPKEDQKEDIAPEEAPKEAQKEEKGPEEAPKEDLKEDQKEDKAPEEAPKEEQKEDKAPEEVGDDPGKVPDEALKEASFEQKPASKSEPFPSKRDFVRHKLGQYLDALVKEGESIFDSGLYKDMMSKLRKAAQTGNLSELMKSVQKYVRAREGAGSASGKERLQAAKAILGLISGARSKSSEFKKAYKEYVKEEMEARKYDEVSEDDLDWDDCKDVYEALHDKAPEAKADILQTGKEKADEKIFDPDDESVGWEYNPFSEKFETFDRSKMTLKDEAAKRTKIQAGGKNLTKGQVQALYNMEREDPAQLERNMHLARYNCADKYLRVNSANLTAEQRTKIEQYCQKELQLISNPVQKVKEAEKKVVVEDAPKAEIAEAPKEEQPREEKIEAPKEDNAPDEGGHDGEKSKGEKVNEVIIPEKDETIINPDALEIKDQKEEDKKKDKEEEKAEEKLKEGSVKEEKKKEAEAQKEEKKEEPAEKDEDLQKKAAEEIKKNAPAETSASRLQKKIKEQPEELQPLLNTFVEKMGGPASVNDKMISNIRAYYDQAKSARESLQEDCRNNPGAKLDASAKAAKIYGFEVFRREIEEGSVGQKEKDKTGFLSKREQTLLSSDKFLGSRNRIDQKMTEGLLIKGAKETGFYERNILDNDKLKTVSDKGLKILGNTYHVIDLKNEQKQAEKTLAAQEKKLKQYEKSVEAQRKLLEALKKNQKDPALRQGKLMPLNEKQMKKFFSDYQKFVDQKALKAKSKKPKNLQKDPQKDPKELQKTSSSNSLGGLS